MGVKKLIRLIIKAVALALAVSALVLLIVKGEISMSIIKIMAISLVCTAIGNFSGNTEINK